MLRNALFFGLPPNGTLLAYWNTIDDRLFKIRNCMNIEGVVRQLPLTDAPIDPALLARAGATGADLAAAVTTETPLPPYRFSVLIGKALELCGDVTNLGNQLLSILERHDAEDLALLRQTHEETVLATMRQARMDQISEADNAHQALEKLRAVVEARETYYDGLEFMNTGEKVGLALARNAAVLQAIGQGIETAASAAKLGLPDPEAGAVGFAPAFFVGLPGGLKIGASMESLARGTLLGASLASAAGQMSTTLGAYRRRQDEWDHQKDLATKELDQIDKQLAVASARLAIARQELALHDLQTRNAREVGRLLTEKFTDRELFNWMIRQVSTVYFASYQLAYDLARRTERAFAQELADPAARFIQFGYWDNLRKGLLAGEKLRYDLRRMESAYLARNTRELEMTKHVSLALLDPGALVRLKQTGECFFDLPEAAFDVDYPGHYLRRIRSVALTVPCVTGPYTGVNCTLTLMSSSVRHDPRVGGPGSYPPRAGDQDGRFAPGLAAVTSIVTSDGQADAGLFEGNLRDERYAPFEGAGAISSWRLQIPVETNRFDLATISDVVLHLRYTARDGGAGLKEAALRDVVRAGRAGAQLFSARQGFADAWYRFLHPAEGATSQVLELDLRPERFPFQPGGEGTHITGVHLFLRVARQPSGSFPIELFDNSNANPPNLLAGKPLTAGDGAYQVAVEFPAGRPHGSWLLRVPVSQIPADLAQPVPGTTGKRLDPDLIEDLYLVFMYGPA